jgi:hypothetical protein
MPDKRNLCLPLFCSKGRTYNKSFIGYPLSGNIAAEGLPLSTIEYNLSFLVIRKIVTQMETRKSGKNINLLLGNTVEVLCYKLERRGFDFC